MLKPNLQCNSVKGRALEGEQVMREEPPLVVGALTKEVQGRLALAIFERGRERENERERLHAHLLAP
jgi:hypothetical protein